MDDLTNHPESSPQSFSEPPVPQRDLRGIFVAKNGLIRAGWGVLLFILIFAALGFFIGHLLHHFLHHHPHNDAFTAKFGLITEGVQLLCVIIATGIMAMIERKSLFAYGYQGAARAVRFFSGLVWGFVAISALVFVLWKSHLLIFDGQFLHGAALLKYAAAWGLVFLFVGLVEESTLRGYVQFTVARGIGFWWAALIFSLLFGLGHSSNPGESPVGLFSAGAVGLVFCLSIWYTGSLWWAVGFHAAWDWGQSYFYGTSDSGLVAHGHLFGEHPVGKILWSGGTTGPEGSLFIVPLLLLIALFMWLWWGRRVQSPFAGSGWRPAWSRKPAVIESESAQEGIA